jgi:hypothetical protein
VASLLILVRKETDLVSVGAEIAIQDFRVFPQSLQVNARILPVVIIDRFPLGRNSSFGAQLEGTGFPTLGLTIFGEGLSQYQK